MIQFLTDTLHPGKAMARCRRSLTCPLLLRVTAPATMACVALIAPFMVPQRLHAESNDRPNIVLILADDLGWSDTTLFGTTKLYQTPNVQRLAARGMTFTHGYSSSPLCSPTRASILTGLSPARTGITAPNCHLPQVVLQVTTDKTAAASSKVVLPNSITRLDPKYYTLAEALNDNGYATAHFGKWHLGASPYSPLQHGFDLDVPHWPGPGPAGSYVAPWKFPDFDPDTPHEHIEDRMAKEAVAFMETHRNEPFFLNYWMFSVHAPFDAKQALIDEYKKKVDPTDPQRSPTYAAMIESMDDAVGTLIDTLDRLDIADNTIIVFASDNGGNMYNEVDGTTPTSNLPLRGGKATMYEGGVRGPAIVVYPGVVKQGSRSDDVIQSSDFYPTLLELVSIKPQPGQAFDGVSIVPALNGKPLDREAIFTYFPHQPRVPDWLPAAVSVHRGDWKLIRLFHGGENGQHRWKLFNLRDDIGEEHDLAAQHPQRVQELDALIEKFLTETGAVVPVINPNFDPSTYHPELEGKATPKGSAPAKRPKRTASSRKPVAGWLPSGDCTLSINDGSLVVMSTGGDPHLSYDLPSAIDAESFTLLFTLVSSAAGKGQVFWREQGVKSAAYHRDRSESFEVNSDGQTHDYAIELAAKHPIVAVRIDPANGPGEIRVSNIRFTDRDGRVLHRWTF